MLLIKNAMVYTMALDKREILEHTDILVDGKKIVSIGKNLVADNATIIDASFRVVLPGLVDAHSHIGGFDPIGEDQDLNEITKPVTAELDAVYGITFDSPSFKQVLSTGITTNGIVPGSANVICGWGVVVKSAGDSVKDRIMRDPFCLKAAMGLNPKGCYTAKKALPMSRLGVAQVMREYFLQVKDYMKAKEEGKDHPEKLPSYDEAMEHGIPVLEKKIPLKVHSYQHDMTTVIAIAKEFDYQVTLDHALGASDYYDEIMDDHVLGVVYGPVGSPVMGGELCKLDYYAMKELKERGKLCAMMTDGPMPNSDMLISEIGEVVRHGLDHYEALRMVTSDAAQICQVFDRVGSIEVGKDADFAIFDAIPSLNASALCVMSIVDGKIVYTRE